MSVAITANGSGIAEGGIFGVRPTSSIIDKDDKRTIVDSGYVCPAFSNTHVGSSFSQVMRIKMKDHWSDKEVERSLSDLVDKDTYDSGAVESASRRAMSAIEFTEKVVDFLYAKGLLSEADIKDLVYDLAYCDKDSIKVV